MALNVIRLLSLISLVLCEALTQGDEASNTKQMEKCLLISNCYDCSVDSGCHWSKGYCSYQESNNSIPWYVRLTLCMIQSNEFSTQSKAYCSAVNEEELPFAPQISEDVITDNVSRLFCKWTLTQFSNDIDYQIEYKPGQFKTNQLAIVISSSNETVEQTLDEGYDVSRSGLRTITIYYYGSDLTKESYQDFVLEIKKSATFSYLIVIVILLTLGLSALFGFIVSLCRNRFKNARDSKTAKEQCEIKGKKVEEMLQAVSFQSLGETAMTMCMICLDNFNATSSVTLFHCRHIYHYDCIKKWIEKDYQNPKCPSCKQSLLDEAKPINDGAQLINVPSSIQKRLQLSTNTRSTVNVNLHTQSNEYQYSNNTAIHLPVNNNLVRNTM